MKTLKCVLVLFLAMAVSAALFAGGQEEKEGAAAKSTGTVDVRWFQAGPYNPDASGPWVENMNKILNKEGYNVVYESVPFAQFNDKQLAMCVAGDTPDTGALNMMIATSLFKQGYFLPLDEYVANSTKIDYENDLLPGPWGNSKYNGKIYGIPWHGDDRLLFINETCFERAGVPLPPETNFLEIGWDGFKQLAQKLTKDLDGDGKMDQYGFAFVGGEHNHFIHDAGDLWHQIDAEMINESATEARCNQEPFVRTVQLYVDLYEMGVVPPDVLNYMSYADVEKMFSSDKVAMWIVGPWEVKTLPSLNPDIKYQVTHLPLAKDGHKASSGGGWHLPIYADAEQKDGAWRVIETMTVDIEPWSFTMYKPAMAKPPWSGPDYKLFVEYLPYTKSPTYAFDQLDEGWKTCMQEIQAAILGQKTAQQAMDDAAAKINRLLKR
jgi:multiple sugar transport system substrate-binding protein